MNGASAASIGAAHHEHGVRAASATLGATRRRLEPVVTRLILGASAVAALLAAGGCIVPRSCGPLAPPKMPRREGAAPEVK